MTQARITAIIADDEPRLAEYLKERLAVPVARARDRGRGRRTVRGPGAPRSGSARHRVPRHPHAGVVRVSMSRAGASRDVRIVFVTAFDQYALAAFERAAVDYLLKPVSDERLAETVARLKAQATPPPGDIGTVLAAIAQLAPGGPQKLAWIRASRGSEVQLIDVEDVCYFQANDKYTSVFTADGESLIRTPLKELAGQLDTQRFWQVHRGTIVNVKHIATTTRDLTGRITLRLKQRPEPLPVSRAYAHLFKQM
jgi:DNA-binding LytR/AlgR family response regulator